jgi:hypothetical protein
LPQPLHCDGGKGSQIEEIAGGGPRVIHAAFRNAISNAFTGLNEAVEHFFPEELKETTPIPEHRPQSGPYTYNKDYFQHLQNNLKLINDHL